MREEDPEYGRLLDEFVRAQFRIDKPKPNQMVGHWGWHARKKREFRKMMIESGQLEDNGIPDDDMDD